MVVVPGPATPVTAPVVEFTVAAAAMLLVHVPPPEISVRFNGVPRHTLLPPVIAGGTGFYGN